MKEANVQQKATSGSSHCWFEVSLKYISFKLWKRLCQWQERCVKYLKYFCITITFESQISASDFLKKKHQAMFEKTTVCRTRLPLFRRYLLNPQRLFHSHQISNLFLTRYRTSWPVVARNYTRPRSFCKAQAKYCCVILCKNIKYWKETSINTNMTDDKDFNFVGFVQIIIIIISSWKKRCILGNGWAS